MRLGVFGGSFDPVHLGHLKLAECCCDQARLDRILFVPAAHQPHKLRAPRASGDQRVEMLRLATASTPAFEASTVEIGRGGPSYTVDTLRELRGQFPRDELFL